jgi:hypothetical protein
MTSLRNWTIPDLFAWPGKVDTKDTVALANSVIYTGAICCLYWCKKFGPTAEPSQPSAKNTWTAGSPFSGVCQRLLPLSVQKCTLLDKKDRELSHLVLELASIGAGMSFLVNRLFRPFGDKMSFVALSGVSAMVYIRFGSTNEGGVGYERQQATRVTDHCEARL